MKSKRVLVTISILILVMVTLYFVLYSGSSAFLSRFKDINVSSCLSTGHHAEFVVVQKGDPAVVKVRVKDVAGQLVWQREFEIPSSQHVSPYELHDCSFYLHKGGGYDFEAEKVLPGYFWSLWMYPYYIDESGHELVRFSQNISGERGKTIKNYGTQFRINPAETFISLEQSYLGEENYALVVKDIATKEDVFMLRLNDVLKGHPTAAGSFSVGKWVERPDGESLISEIYDGARETGLVQVKAGTWEASVYPTPEDVQAGVERAFAPFEPMLAYTDIITWAGFKEVTDAIMDDYIAAGEKKHLFVADMKTGERMMIAEVPLVRGHRFKLLWLSDTELQYVLPDGEVRVWRKGDN